MKKSKIMNGIESRTKEPLIMISQNTKGTLNKLVGNGLQTKYCKSL